MEKSTYEDVRYEVDGPARVGSFDGGFGSAYQARVVGEKRAREIWFLLEQYSAEQAERWGLVNKIVPAGELMPAAKEARARLHHPPGHVLDV